ncbi:hypothetical protein FB567DRAFT_213084 [Paraphoma chrysanthemicola]|uniref:Arginase/deacetylase n=1 Tax=Paraphoma chrysanthemicola TaxID=798071 RepID=A0A8K0QUJ3_9PLEO|nr:hypothetical protein FB567DRAFT_213084 [Paraphoma chrysanthemicola]
MATSKSIALTYVPADCGSIIPGKSKAPQAFRDTGLIPKLRAAGHTYVTEHHALDAPAQFTPTALKPGGVRNEALNVQVCERVEKTILTALTTGAVDETGLEKQIDVEGKEKGGRPFQLILGGECSMLPGILSAFWTHHTTHTSPSARIGLIYIDADTDLSSPASPSSTGTFASMNMTHLMQTSGALESMRKFSRPDGKAVCDCQNTVFFGTNMALSSNTRDHFAYLFEKGYKVVPSVAVARAPAESARDALRYLEDRVDVIVVHLDVDAIDPGTFPLANVPNYTGVEFDAMMGALGVFLASEKVGGLVVAEVNPDHDPGLEMVGRLTGEIVRMLAARREQ